MNAEAMTMGLDRIRKKTTMHGIIIQRNTYGTKQINTKEKRNKNIESNNGPFEDSLVNSKKTVM